MKQPLLSKKQFMERYELVLKDHVLSDNQIEFLLRWVNHGLELQEALYFLKEISDEVSKN